MRSIRVKRAGAFGLGILVLMASAEGAELRRWTRGTTEAANEIVGERSGLSFHLADRPGGIPVLHVTAVPRPDLDQVLTLSLVDPPEPDLEARDPVARIELIDPPNPDRPAMTIQILRPESVTLVGPTGERILMPGGR